jgi:hypothetical protein
MARGIDCFLAITLEGLIKRLGYSDRYEAIGLEYLPIAVARHNIVYAGGPITLCNQERGTHGTSW